MSVWYLGRHGYCALHNTDWSNTPKCPSCPDEKPVNGMRPGYDYPSKRVETVAEFKERLVKKLRDVRASFLEEPSNGDMADMAFIIRVVEEFE